MTTRKIKRTCPDCRGYGRHWELINGWRKCARCNGTGQIEETMEVTK